MACPEIIELEQYLERELDDANMSRLDAHVSSCADCAREIAEMSQNLQLVSSLRRNHLTKNAPPFDFGPEPEAAPAELADPEMIGPYRILRKLGQGGMGSVYEAQQENPRRVVALKMIRPGLMSSPLMARFRHEAQVLGRLRHPGIAQIYEAGTHQTPVGRQPYFVMELVHGRTLIAYAQEKQLNDRQRLELMARICDAVQHAHERGVIHRDLKPDNILVDDSAGAPQPKILDFGVARVVDPDAQHTTIHTFVGQIVGTVAYMSPEQASANPTEIDTRSDVYALGVICYQLLSGRLPYKLNQGSVAESVRTIVQDDPTPLSTLVRSLRGDVTTIVGKALEKDKSRRYTTAAEMAADIRRHLKDEPITAHPPSTIYQLRKFARRNKGLVAGIVATIVVLLLGVIGTSIGMVRARHAAVTARLEANKAKAVNQFLIDMLGSASPKQRSLQQRARGQSLTILEVLNEASNKLNTEGAFKDHPEIEAAVRRTVGDTYSVLGEYATAEPHLRRALAIDEQVQGGWSPEVAEDLGQLGILLHHQGKLDDADRLYRRSMEISRKLFGEQSAEVAARYLFLGGIARDRGNFKEAESLLSQAIEIARQRNGEQSREFALYSEYLAIVLDKQGRIQEAEAIQRRALDLRRRLLGEDHPDVAQSLQTMGVILYRQSRLAEAEACYRECLAIRVKLFGEDHPDVAEILNNLASLLQQQDKLDEVDQLLTRVLAIETKVFGPDSSEVNQRRNNVAMAMAGRGKFAEAEVMLRQVLEGERRTLGPEHPEVATTLQNIGGMLREQKKFDESESMFREALAIRTKVLGQDTSDVALTQYNLASTLRDQHKYPEAESFFRAALATYSKRLGPEHPHTAMAHAGLGAILSDAGRYEEAEAELLTARRLQQKIWGDADKRTIAATRRLMITYELWGKTAEADALRPFVPATQPATAP
jgi:non-specific serine/threonine protein kinase/serine/threonine-protein kinase